MKRTFVTLALVVVFTLSATAFAVLPAQQTAPAPADGETFAALTDFGMPHVMGEECPWPGDSGCGG